MTVEELAKEKEETLAKRAPALDPDSLTSVEAMKEVASELYAKIVKAFGGLFDLQQKEKRQRYDVSLNTSVTPARPTPHRYQTEQQTTFHEWQVKGRFDFDLELV